MLHAAGALKIDEAATAAEADSLWKVRKAISAAVAELMIGKVNEDVVVAPDRVAELIAATREIGVRHDVPIVNFGHLGEGNIHATFIIDPRIPGERERADAAAAELFERVLSMDGSISGEHGIGCTKLPYLARQIGSETMMLMERIKHELDPRGLLNPGKKVLSTGVVGSSPAALVET